jgi:Flp pilus assembly protein TadD
VRIGAARALASLPPAGLSGAQREALEKGVAEWVAAQEFNADRPDSHVNLGTLYAERGESERALVEFAKALEIDPRFTYAVVNRADLLRVLGREAECEASLREAIGRSPREAVLHHVLGLSLVRQNRLEEGLRELAESVRLAPADARFAYVYGVALHDLGRSAESTRVLESALRASPNDRDLLHALASFLQEEGETKRALRAARRLVELEPRDPRARELLGRLEAREAGEAGRGPS